MDTDSSTPADRIKPSSDPCLGCQERQVCSVGVFLPLADGMRPVCVHPCDELDVREWLDEVAALRAELGELHYAIRTWHDTDSITAHRRLHAIARKVGGHGLAG